MALIQSSFENQILDKHVESVLLPRLDRGSTPRSSTNENSKQPETNAMQVFVFVFSQHFSQPDRELLRYKEPIQNIFDE